MYTSKYDDSPIVTICFPFDIDGLVLDMALVLDSNTLLCSKSACKKHVNTRYSKMLLYCILYLACDEFVTAEKTLKTFAINWVEHEIDQWVEQARA